MRLRRGGVGVVEVTGVIGGQVQVPVYSRLFDSVRRSRRFGAVVVDIDSPGGTAAGSEALYHALLRVADAKPVVAYIRGTGASGGYLLSCAASRIVSLPTAMVGSIGVIYRLPVMEQLLQKLGISFSVYKEGSLKDMGGFWRSPTDEEEAKFRSLIDEVYQNFLDMVATGRRMEPDKVRALATGEVYTGKKAHQLGMIDEIGDFQRAVELATELGNARPKPSWVRIRRPLLGRLVGLRSNTDVAELASTLRGLTTGGLYYLAPGLGSGSNSFSG